MDWSHVLLDPLYNSDIAVPAMLAPNSGGTFDVRAMDQTTGVELQLGKLGVTTIKPAARVRARELAQNSIDLSGLNGGSLTLWPGGDEEQVWDIESYRVIPSPNGPKSGEVQLVLIKSASS